MDHEACLPRFAILALFARLTPAMQLTDSTISYSLYDEDDVNDPLEAINRSIFKFNEFILNLLLRPISNVYNDY